LSLSPLELCSVEAERISGLLWTDGCSRSPVCIQPCAGLLYLLYVQYAVFPPSLASRVQKSRRWMLPGLTRHQEHTTHTTHTNHSFYYCLVLYVCMHAHSVLLSENNPSTAWHRNQRYVQRTVLLAQHSPRDSAEVRLEEYLSARYFCPVSPYPIDNSQCG
jgi:hypothetical protein